MRQIRGLVCGVALAVALAPIGSIANAASDHSKAELANAAAQLQLAQQDAQGFADQASLDAANERQIAFLRSEGMRQAQLDNAANARALEQIGTALAAVIRDQGDANARNDLAILQLKANAMVARADDNLINAQAIGRADEIANAQAQSAALHQLADYMTGTLAQRDMSSDRVAADNAAIAMEAPLEAEAQNDQAMGADELFAADTILNAADAAAASATLDGKADGEAMLEHAEASLANAEAMNAEAP